MKLYCLLPLHRCHHYFIHSLRISFSQRSSFSYLPPPLICYYQWSIIFNYHGNLKQHLRQPWCSLYCLIYTVGSTVYSIVPSPINHHIKLEYYRNTTINMKINNNLQHFLFILKKYKHLFISSLNRCIFVVTYL